MKDSFEIILSVRNSNKSEDIDTKQEMHKLADAVWEKYPRAQVATQLQCEESNNMIFEVENH